MRTYFREYRCLAKAGLLSASHRMIIATSVFMLLVGNSLGVGLEILLFILTPIGYMLDFDANKYVINYTLPISMKKRLKMLYYMTIAGDFMAVLMVYIRYYIEGQKRSITLTLLVFMFNLIGCNLYYYLFCSPEFKKDILSEDKGQLLYQCVIGAAIGIMIAIRLKHGKVLDIDCYIRALGNVWCTTIVGVLSAITLWWTRCSMKRVQHIVRSWK